jgi:hypothetical protein
MTARMKISNTQLREWKATNYPYKLIAAVVAEWAASQERGSVLPDDEYFRIEASPTTYQRAKKLLQTHGVIEVNGGPFYVALQTPPGRFPGDRDEPRMAASLPRCRCQPGGSTQGRAA